MWVATCLTGYVSMLHQNEGVIGIFTPDAQDISRDPLGYNEGNLKGRRGGSPYSSGVLVEHCHSLHHKSFTKEWIRKSFPVDREELTVLNPLLPCK